MNKETKTIQQATKPILNALVAIHTRETLDELWSNALDSGHLFSDRNEFDQWVAEYVLDSIHDLFEEYDIEIE